MALPTSATWNLVDFDEATIPMMLGSGPSDVSFAPSIAPYFTYDTVQNLIQMRSDDGVLATASLNVGVPNQFTFEITLRFPEMPNNTGDVATRRIGITLSDGASRGISIYFAKTGIAVSRIDDFGSVTSLPDTTDFTSEVDLTFHTLRVAVDAGLGQAYVYLGPAGGTLELLFIIPVEATPAGTGDLFRLFAKGLSTDTASIQFRDLRLGTGLIIPNFPPTANAGSDHVTPVGQAVRLDGRASFDIEGAPLSYLWQAIEVPYGSSFAYDASDGTSIDDGDADGFTDTLSFTPSTLPVWVQAGDVLVIQGTHHTIDTINNPGGSLTVLTDTIPEPLTLVPFRVIRQSVLVGATTETPYMVPDIAGLYRIHLVVNDGVSDSSPAEVLVSIVGSRAPFGVEPSTGFIMDAIGDEWKYIENRQVFVEFWRGISQVLAGRLLEAWQYHYNFSIRDAQRVFQKKWVAYRTLIAETSPETATISPRYGLLIGTYDFSLGDPVVTGNTLVFDFATSSGATAVQTIVVTLSGNPIGTIISDINTALGSFGTAFQITDGPHIRLAVRSPSRAFKINSSSTAAGLLGFTTSIYNYLAGTGGALVTDRTYIADPGVDFSLYGIQPNDLLVLGGGQSFRIDRYLSDPGDVGPNQRLLLIDPLPFDATATWSIPSVVRSTTTDYELAGTYPGDLVKAEVFDTTTSTHTDVKGIVVAEKGSQLAANLDGFFDALLDTVRYDIRLLGVKRRKAIPIADGVLSVPQLQYPIPQSQNPTLWKENIDYYLEPFYRNTDESAIPMLQFRDSVFILPDLEPPDIFWAELTLFDNDVNIENLFGLLVGFTRDNAKGFGSDFAYASAVAGLLYSHQGGPNIYSMRVGLQILFGQPFAEVAGIITEIRDDYSPTTGRILIQDDDGYTPPRTDVVRSYIYKKDPFDLSPTSGLEINPTTGVPYALGDKIAQFAPIGTGVEILDYINTPDWFFSFLRSSIFTELGKFFRFLVQFNLDLVSLTNLLLVSQFVYRIKPTYTSPILLGIKNVQDEVNITDNLDIKLILHEYDALCGAGPAYMYDDYRGDGTTWIDYDDTVYYDQLVNCPHEHIEFVFTIAWPGGAITYDTFPFFYDTDIVDTSGAHTGTPGTHFSATYDMTLEAGTYTVTAVIKDT